MTGLPVPGVLRHFVQVARYAPVQLAVGLGSIRPVGREVAIAARREMVVNGFAAGLAESIDYVEHAAADAGAKVVPRFYVSTSKSIIKALINMHSFEIQLSPIG